MVGGDHPDRACEQSESERNQLELEITIVVMILYKSNKAQLIEASMGAHQPKNQAESMDYEGSGPSIFTPLIQVAHP
jgi:NurA-like 5'-3' nuclease